MDKNHLIQLTQNLYRLTLLFPKKEPLRYKMRELADEILADYLRIQLTEGGPLSKLTEVRPLEIVSKLEILDSFFEVAKAQNWVAKVELLKIQEEYNRIKAEIKKISKRIPEKEETLAKLPEVGPLLVPNSRQEKILEFLKENGRAQVWQLKQIFPEVTKRTLRRDVESLVKQGIIERVGQRNNTFYQLK